MPTYLSPGVYVEEIASGSAPIASLSTSTAGFIGIVPDEIQVPISPLMQVTEAFEPADGQGTNKNEFHLTNFPVNINVNAEVLVIDTLTGNSLLTKAKPTLQPASNSDKRAKITLDSAPTANQKVKVKYIVESVKVTNEAILTIPQDTDLSSSTDWKIKLTRYPVNNDNSTWTIKANGGELDKTGVTITNDAPNKVSIVTIPVNLLTSDSDLYDSDEKQTKLPITITADYQVTFPKFSPVTAKEKIR